MLGGFLPDGLSAVAATILVIASFFTSALTAAFGVGGGLAMLALMGVFVPVAQLIPVHGAVQLGSNAGRAWHQRAHVRMDIVMPFAAGSVVGAIAGVFVVIQLPDAVLKLVLGLFIIAITWARLPKLEVVSRPLLTVASAGLALLGMFVGATGPLLSAILARFFADDRKALVATHGAVMISQHAFKLVVFAVAGFAFAAWAPLVLAMILSGYLGTIYGTTLLERMPEDLFRRWFRLGLTLLAVHMLWQAASAAL
ncbi:MAG: sulfite exporter TauE/SafE family protein [Rhizobiaceae bacterium]|nr:sulfite exporter TauE/SafE family protein [Rhizobiaceae bacterium]MCV0406605.1 sulfite exporter TauE/SafE family protein [Rhizobiaceae bacterium]